MQNYAIIAGNSHYDNLNELECCSSDISAMEDLLQATNKYAKIFTYENRKSEDIKLEIRQAIEEMESPKELFFYFTGHGCQIKDDMYLCATDFDPAKPNDTGISTNELHTFLRIPNADLIVKLIDACNSGIPLVKSESPFSAMEKSQFSNFIQMASCLNSQHSFTGVPLSLFTEHFIKAATSKNEGQVFYLDIINRLKDDFLNNDIQTPFFISQGTGREIFAEDAKTFAGFRRSLPASAIESKPDIEQANSNHLPEIVDIFQTAESDFTNRQAMILFIDNLFDSIKNETTQGLDNTFFDQSVDASSHLDYSFPSEFIVDTLRREPRIDNFVHAEYTRKYKKLNPIYGFGRFDKYIDDDQVEEIWSIWINCDLPKIQMSIKMKPKFKSLKQIQSLITCAPSLNQCFVFENYYIQELKDFDKYYIPGKNVKNKWHKMKWNDQTNHIARGISKEIENLCHEHVTRMANLLTKIKN